MTSSVKILREQLNLTQSELASYLGVSRNMIWAYETGKYMPRLDKIKKLMSLAKKHNLEFNLEDFYND